MYRVPESAVFLFTSTAECERYRIAARMSRTDIRVIIAAEKFQVVRKDECRLLSHRQLNLLLDVLMRGARAQKSTRAIREEWLLTLLKDHGEKGALGHYLRVDYATTRVEEGHD